MGMKQTLDVINRMEADGIIGRYAIAGAVAAYNYIEPTVTEDLDILVSFDQPVFGAGAYIQDDPFGAFTGIITLYDSSFNFLGTFSAPGNSDTNVGTALFIGAYDSTADVSYALFDTNDDIFAIGTMRLATVPVTVVPEPSTMLLVAPSMLGLAGIVRRRLTRKEVR